MTQTASTIEGQRERLAYIGQEHVLSFIDELDDAQRAAFTAQLAGIELERVPEWVDRFVRAASASADDDGHGEIEPAPVYRADGSWDIDSMREAGEALIAGGKVAAFTVAGGQGTRLGFDGPKGMYPATPIRRLPLFGCLAEWLVAATPKWGVRIPWYIMTSPLNHAATVAFFREQSFFGLDESDVRFFSQGVLPSLDRHTGKLLLEDKGTLATNPDGHGGSLRALHTSGALAEMRDRGIEHISYTQIDNPLARLIDPVFLGLHASPEYSSGEMSTKVVLKMDPAEKVGVLGVRDGKTMVVEYSDLSSEMASRRDAQGRLSFGAGNIAIHALGVEFVARLNEGNGFGLPLHRAIKKVACVDLDSGERVEPGEPNAVKLESFVFDALPLCARSLVYEVERTDEFAPIKNAEGADSPATSCAIQIERAAGWLERAGVDVKRTPEDRVRGVVEISPTCAMNAEDLAAVELPGTLGDDDLLELL